VSKRVKLSKEEFAEFLLHWVAMHLSIEGVKQDAKVINFDSDTPLESREAKEMFGLGLSKEEELIRLYEELMPLNLWMVVFTCESKFSDVKQRNDCLDIFHRRFFDQFLKDSVADTVENFEQWMHIMGVRYYEYGGAIKTGTGKDLMTLARLVQRNLHGEGHQSAIVNLEISLYVGERMKVLAKALDQYEIE
jgi:hypothetical protein